MYLCRATLDIIVVFAIFSNQLAAPAFAESDVNAFHTNGDESFADGVVNKFHHRPGRSSDDGDSVTNDVEMLPPNGYANHFNNDYDSVSMTNGNVSIGSRSGKLYYDDYMGSLDFPEPNNYDYGKPFIILDFFFVPRSISFCADKICDSNRIWYGTGDSMECRNRARKIPIFIIKILPFFSLLFHETFNNIQKVYKSNIGQCFMNRTNKKKYYFFDKIKYVSNVVTYFFILFYYAVPKIIIVCCLHSDCFEPAPKRLMTHNFFFHILVCVAFICTFRN